MSDFAEHVRRQWFVATQARNLRRRPLAVTVLGTPLVLYRLGEQVVVAEDRCPHRNAPLSLGTVTARGLRCPYHGWCFDRIGRCVESPGIASPAVPEVGLRTWRVQIVDGQIWVRPPDPSASRPTIEPVVYRPSIVGDPRYQAFTMTDDLEAELGDALENLLDGTHTPFVHAGLVRSEEASVPFTATVRRSDERIEVEYRGEDGQRGLISRWFEPRRVVSFGRFVPPCTAELEYRSERRVELFVAAHFTPGEDHRVRVVVNCYLPPGRFPTAIRHAVARLFFRRVLRQDREMLRAQTRNILRFGGPAYKNWTADVMRPWIDAWLRDGQFPHPAADPQTVEFRL